MEPKTNCDSSLTALFGKTKVESGDRSPPSEGKTVLSVLELKRKAYHDVKLAVGLSCPEKGSENNCSLRSM